MKNVFAFLLIALFTLSTSAQNRTEESLLWEVSGPDEKISYLFGTYHLLGSDYLKQKPILEAIYHSCQVVVVETVMDSSLLPQLSMQSFMQESIKLMTDSADYALLKKELEPVVGAPMSLLDRMKPIALATALSLEYAQKATPDTFLFSGAPIDLYFADNATKNKKRLVPLESMLEQAEMLLNGESVQEQLDGLLYIIKEKEETKEITERTIRAYMEQDLSEMLKISERQEEDLGDMKILLDDRNKRWVPLLEPLLEDGQVFIAVGALHLPGEFGLIELLKNEGYSLRPLKLK